MTQNEAIAQEHFWSERCVPRAGVEIKHYGIGGHPGAVCAGQRVTSSNCAATLPLQPESARCRNVDVRDGFSTDN